MKKITIVLVLILALLFSATGCSKAASQTVEEGKTTPEYLTGEFAKKLEKDGAKVYLGKITEAKFLTGSTGQITFVELKNGVEQKPRDLVLDGKFQGVYVTNSNPKGEIMDGKQFIKAFVPGKNDAFRVFVMNDKVVLLFSEKL